MKWNSFARISAINSFNATRERKKKIFSKKYASLIIKGREENIYIYIHVRRTSHRVTFSQWEICARSQLIATQFLHTGPLYSFGPEGKPVKDSVQFSGNRRDLSRRSHCYQSLAWPILGFLIFCINNAPQRLTIQETWTVPRLSCQRISLENQEGKIERGSSS